MERSGGRRRGESFHEEFEKPKSSSHSPGQHYSMIHHAATNHSQNDHNSSNSTNKRTDKAVEFMTSEFNPHHSEGPEPLDLSQLEDDIDEESTEDEEDSDNVDEDEVFSRGRSRSHSMHQNDSLPLPLPGEGPAPFDLNQINSGQANESKAFEKVERTGPLHQREVQALRKGLEQATQSRNKEDLLEEEQERKDAEAERLLRLGVTANQHNPTVNALNMTDQITRKVKLLLLGDSGVGKSSLILRWTMDTFNASLISTFGVNFKSKRVHINSEAIQVQVWDTAGQEQFHKITTSYYRGANAIILVFDVSDRLTFNNVEYWMKSIKAHATDAVHVVLVGNKTDLRTTSPAGKCITYEKGKEVADRFSVPYFETSAKDSMNVDLAFMTPVRTIVESETRANSLSHDSDGKKLVEKTSKVGLLQKLMKENPLSSKPDANHDNPDEKEKCVIS